jgi:hypothetical protein
MQSIISSSRFSEKQQQTERCVPLCFEDPLYSLSLTMAVDAATLMTAATCGMEALLVDCAIDDGWIDDSRNEAFDKENIGRPGRRPPCGWLICPARHGRFAVMVALPS